MLGVFCGVVFRRGLGGAGEVWVPALEAVEKAAILTPPAGGFAWGFVEPGDEVETVHGPEPGFRFFKILLHAGKDRVPDDEIDER